MGMDATELARWTRFAAKGGIGKCTAISDCVAESPDDLMFLKDDEITVLMQLPDAEGMFLGHCEGVVGRFHGSHVHFHSKLKKPVMTKRQSSSAASFTSTSAKPNSPSPGPSRPASYSKRDKDREGKRESDGYGSAGYRDSDSLPRRSSSRAPSRAVVVAMGVGADEDGFVTSASSTSGANANAKSFSAASAYSASTIGSYNAVSVSSHVSPSASIGYNSHMRFDERATRVASPLWRVNYGESESESERRGVSRSEGEGKSRSDGEAKSRSDGERDRERERERRGSGRAASIGASSRRAAFPTSSSSPPLASPPPNQSSFQRVISPPLSSPPATQTAFGASPSPGFGTTRRTPPPSQGFQRVVSPPLTSPPATQVSFGTSPSPAFGATRTPPPQQSQQQSQYQESFRQTQPQLTSITPPPPHTNHHPSSSQDVEAEFQRVQLLANRDSVVSTSSLLRRSQSLSSPSFDKESPFDNEEGTGLGIGGLGRSATLTMPTSPLNIYKRASEREMRERVGRERDSKPFGFDNLKPERGGSRSPLNFEKGYGEGRESVLGDEKKGEGEREKEEREREKDGDGEEDGEGTEGEYFTPEVGEASLLSAPQASSSQAGSPQPPPQHSPQPVQPTTRTSSTQAMIPAPLSLLSPSLPSPHPRTGLPSSMYPDTSVTSRFSRVFEDEHDGVGIGLSMLQDLVDGMESSDEEGDGEWYRNEGGKGKGKGREVDSGEAEGGRHSVGLYGSERGSVGGLGYASASDEGEEEGERTVEDERDMTIVASLAPEGGVGAGDDARTPKGTGFPRVDDEDQDEDGGEGEGEREPTVSGHGYGYGHTAAKSISSLSPNSATFPTQGRSPTSQTFPPQGRSPTTQSFPPQGRSPTNQSFPPQNLSPSSATFPTLSPSSASFPSPTAPFARERTSSINTTSSQEWDGYADIYDDYRYSRFSMASKMSRFSVASGFARGGGGVEEAPPVPHHEWEGRSEASGGVRRSEDTGSGVGRGSVDTTASVIVGKGKGKEKEVVDEDEDEDEDVPESRHARLASVDSEASVYTQASRLSLLASLPTAAAVVAETKETAGNRPQPLDFSSGANRPVPLDLTNARSPLLNTTWGSPMSSPGEGSMASASAMSTGFTGISLGSPGFGPPTMGSVQVGMGVPGVATPIASAGVQPPGVQQHPPAQAPSAFAGIASSLRQRLEIEKEKNAPASSSSPSPSPALSLSQGGNKRDSQSVMTRDGDGLGGRIVIEDDEELPSKIMDSSLATDTSVSYAESPSPEPVVRRLGTLAVVNRTPSPASPSTGENEGDKEEDGREKQKRLDGFDESTSLISASGSTAQQQHQQQHPHPPPPLLDLPPGSPVLRSLPTPTLADLREGGLQVPGENKRRSLFLPHPNAPKAPSASSPGPMYITSQQQQVQQQQAYAMRAGPPRQPLVEVMRMAMVAPRPPMPPARAPGMLRGPTVYGRTEIDLGASMGPVPISFTLEPPPPPVAPAPIPARAPPSPSPLRSTSVPVPGGAYAPRVGEIQKPPERQGSLDTQLSNAGTLPRANFQPKAPGARPRSRSFSGFNSTDSEASSVVKSHDEPAASVEEAGSTPSSPVTASPPAAKPVNTKPSPLRPSPLSLSQNAVTGAGVRGAPGAGAKSPTSPLSQSLAVPPISSSIPPSPAASMLSHRGLGRMGSRSTLDDPSPSPRNVLLSRSPLSGADTSSSSSSPVQTLSKDGRPSVDADSVSLRSSHSQLASPPPMDRRQSLRTKLSLPNLRRNRSKQDDTGSLASPIVDTDTLQVKDMDFELVRPNVGRFEASRASEDSGVLGRDESNEPRPEFLRASSPALSVGSGGNANLPIPRSPISDPPPSTTSLVFPGGPSAPASRATTDSESSMDAHRQRESKWVTIMASTPPSQSRKSKKVKKLLLEGVPSSVRYLVWSMLTDGKARVVPEVYSKLGQRGRVPASSDIERDTKSCFQDQPHLHGTEGPVLSLLQAYFSMVPDVQYTRGLTLIAGQLLLLAPEEDAFWIFVSIMDTHIRPYFSTTVTQMEVDSALFSRAFESNDSVAAKKVFVDMGINPSSICAPWFSSLFVGSLPPDYLNRVWDIFLFEGIPFLLRVGLAIMQCCRRQVLGSTSEETLLALLRHPPAAMLPSTPDAFLTLAFSMKLKDDDVRKQRVKMEAQVKRQTQTPGRITSTTAAISLPRS